MPGKGAVAEERHERDELDEQPGSFDPGLETGYLRRGPRERELPLDAGAAPFDPGPGIGYDRKRAKRLAKNREQGASEPVEPQGAAGQAVAEVELEELDLGDVEELDREREERERLARERHLQDIAERRARLEREREELERQARLEELERERELEERRQREELEREERRRRELERRAQIEEEREREARAERERRRRERAEAREQWKRERQAVEGKRRKRKERRRAERAEAKRRRAKRQVALSRGRRPPAVAPQATAAPPRPTSKAPPRPASKAPRRPARRRSAPAPKPKAAKLRRPPRRGKLVAPTAKVGLALAAVTAAATFLGAALGLPVPVITSDDDLAASLTGAVLPNDSGTPTGLTKGPYFPVVLDAPADYAEAAAKFGASRGGRKHEGQDIFAKPGTPLVAVRDGIVIDGGGGKSFYSYGGGNSLVIYSPLDQRSYVYLHLLKPATVAAGETVHAGQVVGQMGCTGSCDGTHLHFEVREGRVAYGAETKAIDPLPLLQEWPQAPTE